MDIALIGYGKMGKAIEKIALQTGHDVLLKIGSGNMEELNHNNLLKCDVAIEFTNPESCVKNINLCFDAGIPVVCGSTGWLKHLQAIKDNCNEKNGSFLYASNFSIGVNIFFALNNKLAELMNGHEYDPSIEEIHHTEKKDSPSGTAITLAEQIININPIKTSWVNFKSDKKSELTITSSRMDAVPGTHHIKYSSPIDDIEITHTAHNRQGFAYGAIMAAEFLKSKKGIFTMKDVLGF